MIVSRTLPHRRQSDQGRNCGAACLAMLLEHYKIRPSNLKEMGGQCAITISLPNMRRSAAYIVLSFPRETRELLSLFVSNRGLSCS